MAISTYSELVTAIGAWLNKGTSYDSVIPDFIVMAEARFNRVLRVPEMEGVVTSTLSGATQDLPTDFLEVRSLFLDTDPRQELEPVSLGTLRTKYAVQTTGKPEVYAIAGGEFVFGPAPDDDYTANLTYYAAIPALSVSNTSNWLLAAHPDIYLRACLVEAEFYGWNDDRLPLIKSAVDEALSELVEQGNRKRHGNAPLRLRASVSE